MDKKQFKLLKYIDNTRSNPKYTFQDLTKLLSKKLKSTERDIIEMLNDLKKLEYIAQIGLSYSIITTHKGHTFVTTYKYQNIKIFIKDYFYPIIVTAIGCFLTYYLSN